MTVEHEVDGGVVANAPFERIRGQGRGRWLSRDSRETYRDESRTVEIEPIEPVEPSALIRRTFWIPGACLIAVEVYARRFDGWGAWSTAPLFLIPSILSLAVVLAGLRDLWVDWRAGRKISATLLLIVLAASPFAWLLVRRLFV